MSISDNRYDLVDEIWKNNFTNGEHVLIITVDDHWDYGVLKNYKTYITLSSDGTNTPYRHDEIMFICHDGFPMRWVKSEMDGHASETDKVVDFMKKTFPRESKSIDGKLAKERTSMRIGDPYEILDVSPTIVGIDDIMMTAGNGSVGLLHYTKPVFDVEYNGVQVCI